MKMQKSNCIVQNANCKMNLVISHWSLVNLILTIVQRTPMDNMKIQNERKMRREIKVNLSLRLCAFA